jgi:hypothetical protein
LCDSPTGRASCTTDTDYHGPGRGAGNAIGVLIDGWLASRQDRYIDFAESLIRRTIHPDDNIDTRDFNNFELRWSYTVYLQQLARYLLLTEGVQRPDTIREYAAASLLHYADWMVDNDRFYLDYPEQLEYPTETWAAQELRKGNVLYASSRYARGPQNERLKVRAKAIQDRAWTTLMNFTGRSFTRPIALVLQQGYIEAFFSTDTTISDEPLCSTMPAVGPPRPFQTQRAELRTAIRSPMSLLKRSPHAMRPRRWRNIVRGTWLMELARRAAEKI